MKNNAHRDARTAFFDRLAGTWDDGHDLQDLAGRLDAMFDTFGVCEAETLLDVGCGTGNLTGALLRRIGPEGRVIAVDISPGMLDRARRKIGDSRVTWVQAAADRIPVADGGCGRVICFSAWPHFKDPVAVVREFHRVLESGGCVHLFHLISREAVNRIHTQADPSVRTDLLVPVGETAARFERAGFAILTAEDDDRHYLLTARKGG